MDMRMVHERLPPSVQHCDEAELGTEVFGISGDCFERVRRCGEERTVDLPFVLQGQRRELGRQREDAVEVLYW